MFLAKTQPYGGVAAAADMMSYVMMRAKVQSSSLRLLPERARDAPLSLAEEAV